MVAGINEGLFSSGQTDYQQGGKNRPGETSKCGLGQLCSEKWGLAADEHMINVPGLAGDTRPLECIERSRLFLESHRTVEGRRQNVLCEGVLVSHHPVVANVMSQIWREGFSK